MSVHPPDPLDLVAQWRGEADALDAIASTQKTMGAAWKAREEATTRRDYADQLEQHMRGGTRD